VKGTDLFGDADYRPYVCLSDDSHPFSAKEALYRRSRPSASGLDPEGEGRTLIPQATVSTSTVATWIKELNPKQLPAVARKCDTSQTPATAGETGVVGRGGAADPHGRTGRSGVNSSRPISGRSRGIKFACDGTAHFGTCGQDGEAAGLAPAVLHAAITTTQREAAVRLTDRDFATGGLPRDSYATPWTVVSIRHADIDRAEGRLIDAMTEQVATESAGYLGVR